MPSSVKPGTVYEAESIADGTRERIARLIDAGLTGQRTGSVSGQYRQLAAGPAGGLSLKARAAARAAPAD